MNNYLNKIAVVGSSNRFNAITNILKGMKIEYEVIGETTKNIVVSFNKSSKRTVVGAHYDAYYSGANDNGAACVILLNLIDELRNTTNSYDFVFFDKDEYGGIGSSEYIKIIGSVNIKAMINLDMCGLGTNMMLCYNDLNTNTLALNPYSDIINNCKNVVKSLPFGDYNIFISAKIPAIFIINSTDNDLEWFKAFANGRMSYRNPDFLETMHKVTDTPDRIDPYGMTMICDYLLKYLK